MKIITNARQDKCKCGRAIRVLRGKSKVMFRVCTGCKKMPSACKCEDVAE